MKQYSKKEENEDNFENLHNPELKYDENLTDKMNENLNGNLLSRII